MKAVGLIVLIELKASLDRMTDGGTVERAKQRIERRPIRLTTETDVSTVERTECGGGGGGGGGISGSGIKRRDTRVE